MTAWRMKGEYLKNCNCIATCPCDTEGFPKPYDHCEGIAAMHIVEGNFGDVKLDGLHWAAIVQWPGAIHQGNGVLQPLLDERASDEQRAALGEILSGKHGGTFFQIIAAMCPTVHEPKFVPFQWEFDAAGRHARLQASEFLRTATEPLSVPASGERQHVIVRLPDGFEYKEMEVARSTMLDVSGPITFSHRNTNSSMAHVEHTDAGLVA